ncbi:hypothetical protein JZ751_011693 [Albula glossodonta]|uniref:Uncharacterized protein n=1 Tax=Albula glossodonta TaxID=121402 RepID=A0A8T2PQF0_9TELE|nr:hypothetical protein JZ751_011693 [Albula glossodonta]
MRGSAIELSLLDVPCPHQLKHARFSPIWQLFWQNKRAVCDEEASSAWAPRRWGAEESVFSVVLLKGRAMAVARLLAESPLGDLGLIPSAVATAADGGDVPLDKAVLAVVAHQGANLVSRPHAPEDPCILHHRRLATSD